MRVPPLFRTPARRCNRGMALPVARLPMSSRHPRAARIAGLSARAARPHPVHPAGLAPSLAQRGPVQRHRAALTATVAGTLMAALILLGLTLP